MSKGKDMVLNISMEDPFFVKNMRDGSSQYTTSTSKTLITNLLYEQSSITIHHANYLDLGLEATRSAVIKSFDHIPDDATPELSR